MMRELHQRGIYQFRAIRLICFLCLVAFFVSCKTIDINKYHLVNSLLNDYTEKDSVYLHPKIVRLDDKKINEFLLLGIDKDSCNSKMKDIISNIDRQKQLKTTDKTWNYAKIDVSKVFTNLELKRPQSIIRFKKLKETIKDDYDLLDRKFLMWKIEHDEGMIRLSNPIFNKQKTHAIIYLSKHNDGQFVYTLKKVDKKKWSVICKKRLSFY